MKKYIGALRQQCEVLDTTSPIENITEKLKTQSRYTYSYKILNLHGLYKI